MKENSYSPDAGEPRSAALLRLTLALAVPLWIEQVQRCAWPPLQEAAREGARYIAQHGDVMMFGGGKEGVAATAINHLARGLAIGALAPGGITFDGMHWEAEHLGGAAPVPPVEAKPIEQAGEARAQMGLFDVSA
jgi:hypothetical protein